MPEHLRSLVIILILSTIFYTFAGRTASVSAIVGKTHFTTRRNLWFGITLAAFLAHSFWVYTFIAILLLLHANRRETNPPALFFFILFAVPIAYAQIPGFGLINFFFDLSHARILALFILLPAYFALTQNSNTLSFGRTGPDKMLAAYLILNALLHLRDSSFTETLRQTFYLFMDVFLPYFVISRSLKNMQAFKDALMSLTLAIMLLALFAGFESFKHWLLYGSLLHTLNLHQGMTGYLGRDDLLRVMASAGNPIALGLVMAAGIGFYLFLQKYIEQKHHRRLGMALLSIGLIAPVSRGPWVGTALLLVVFIATGRNPVKRLMSLAVVGALILGLVAALPGGERIINLLPFIGTTEKSTIDYREDLITSTMVVIQRNPWFGSVDFLEEPEMQAMRQNGLVDVVNSYIGLALESGLVGLGLFVGFFAAVVLVLYKAMHSLSDKDSEEYLLGRSLLATQLAILLIIFTVSSITVIPIMCWSVAALGVAYVQMVRKQANSTESLPYKPIPK